MAATIAATATARAIAPSQSVLTITICGFIQTFEASEHLHHEAPPVVPVTIPPCNDCVDDSGLCFEIGIEEGEQEDQQQPFLSTTTTTTTTRVCC
jgi:hypothetical protein